MRYFFAALVILSMGFGFLLKEITLEIDFSKNDTVKLSQLVDTVRAVSLHGETMPVINKIRQVVQSGNFIFISDQKVTSGIETGRVLQFDLSGLFIRQVGDSRQGGIKFATNEKDNALFVGSKNGIAKKYDYDGRYMTTVTTTGDGSIFGAVLHQGKFWKTRINDSGLELINVNSEKPDAVGKGYFITQRITIKPPGTNVEIGSFPVLFTTGDDLYISYSITDRIYRFTGSAVEPAYRVTFKGVKFKDTDRAFRTNVFLTESFLHYEYIVNVTSRFALLYDLKEKKSYHFRNQDNKSGIEDDIFKSGYVQITPLNRAGYIYFVKTKEELPVNFNLQKNGPGPMLFFARVKS